MASEVPEALTKAKIIETSGSVDFGPRIDYITRGLYPDDEKAATLVGIGMACLLEPIEDGRIEVPEGVEGDKFELWLLGLTLRGLTEQLGPQPDA